MLKFKSKKIITLFVFSISIIAIVFFAVACKDEKPVEPKPPKPVSILGVWKLVAFVDEENNTSRQPEYPGFGNDSMRYTLSFYDFLDSVQLASNQFIKGYYANGVTVANGLFGCYSVDYNTNILTMTMQSTLVLEGIEDATLYWSIFVGVEKILPFNLFADTLQLFYNDKKNYLEFKKIGGFDD